MVETPGLPIARLSQFNDTPGTSHLAVSMINSRGAACPLRLQGMAENLHCDRYCRIACENHDNLGLGSVSGSTRLWLDSTVYSFISSELSFRYWMPILHSPSFVVMVLIKSTPIGWFSFCGCGADFGVTSDWIQDLHNGRDTIPPLQWSVSSYIYIWSIQVEIAIQLLVFFSGSTYWFSKAIWLKYLCKGFLIL